MITITFLDGESTAEEAPVDIVLERLSEGGSVDELQLEGGLNDAHALVSTLEAEGNCVKVEIVQPESEESVEEAPGVGEEAVEAAESPVPDSP